MPGMDGFQAVQAIKNNPRTAMIPIMMYTSQEGELYLGQARALGAVGVLPKQIKPTDVSKVLYQLNLAPDRRTGEQTSFRPYTGDGESATGDFSPIPPAPVAHAVTDLALREQLAELRHAVMAGLDSQSERVAADVRSMFLEGMPSNRTAVLPWLVALLSLITAIAASVLWRQESQRARALTTELAEVRDIDARTSAAAVSPAVAEAPEIPSAQAADPIVAQIPYGEEAFGGARLEMIRQLFRRLESQNFRGTVELVTYPGRFCLVGNPAEGFSLAPDETPAGRCDLLGNPYEDSQPGSRQPLGLANIIGVMRDVTRGAAEVKVNSGDPATVVNTYPRAMQSATAGEWNRAASANNRLEIRLH
jgi:CheY-like chemotaxis protein